MNEFLKSFRSKQKSRAGGGSTNAYDGHYYPSQDRRNDNDRRSHGNKYQTSINALIEKLNAIVPLIQEALDETSDQKEALYKLHEKQIETASETAVSLREIAKNLGSIAQSVQGGNAEVREKSALSYNRNSTSISELSPEEMRSPADERKDILKTIKKMRSNGGTYKEIASFLNAKNIPTFSNKGNWHAQTIHRICSQK